MHLEQSLRTVLSSKVRLRNIFKAPKVAGHFCVSHHIPSETLSEISRELIKEIQYYAGEKDNYKVLEVGIGVGRFTVPFAVELDKYLPGSKVYGLDNSKAMLREAKKNIPDANFIEYKSHDITSALSYSEDYFDASISFYVYHCINNWRKALNNVIQAVASPKLLIFLRERSQWGYHLDCRFKGIKITNKDYCKFWKEYFKIRQSISPLPKVEISASNLDLLKDYLKKNGFRHVPKTLKTTWNRTVTYSESLESIEAGLFTKLRVGLTDRDRNLLKTRMLTWLKNKNIKLDSSPVRIPAAIEVDIYYRKRDI